MHGDDDQIVPYADPGPLSAELMPNATLKLRGYCSPDAAEVLLAVSDQHPVDDFLDGDRWHVRQDCAALCQLRVAERADHCRGRRRARLEQRERLRLGTGGMVPRVLRVH